MFRTKQRGGQKYLRVSIRNISSKFSTSNLGNRVGSWNTSSVEVRISTLHRRVTFTAGIFTYDAANNVKSLTATLGSESIRYGEANNQRRLSS
jgi:hypothetical protein